MNTRLCARCKKHPAVIFISRMDGAAGPPEGICIHCAKELHIKPIDEMLERMNISDEDLDAMSEQVMMMMGSFAPPSETGEDLAEEESDDPDISPGGAATLPFLQNGLFGPPPEETRQEIEEPEQKERRGFRGKKQKKRRFLDGYCTNLTKRAQDGQLDPIVGRENELYRVVQILSRRTKNNPCLIGEPGVGKTAIAEGLALRIAAGQVQPQLLDKEVHLLDLTALVAGTQFRGQFESRVKGLVDEVKAEGNIILFIDEVHNLVGTGDAEGSMNAANILKPALSRGEIQVIGATTFKEYRKYIERDAALERRFQPVTIEEPSIDAAVEILRGVRPNYETYHHVTVPDALLRRAVVLSERYIHDRFLPDKAIDLLDEGCACAALRNRRAGELLVLRRKLSQLSEQEQTLENDPEQTDYEQLAMMRSELARLRGQEDALAADVTDTVLTEEDLARVIELWTGIPAAKVRESDLGRLSKLEGRLMERVVGQDDAVGMVAAAVRRSRVQISARRRPASFLFVGPTGVGKTELVKVLASELFDTPETLIRLDMSEFMEKHSVSRIIGAPPGYVGYDEAGQLTEKVRRKPYSVLLFDEIEKAHPDVLNILLQILDDGRVTDAQGRSVNFENTLLVMTSNAGSEKRDKALGFGKQEADASRERAVKALEEFLRPEFISRVDEIVVFRPLTGADYARIAALMLGELVAPLREKGIEFRWDDDTPAALAAKAYGGKRGARDLRRLIRVQVEDRVASLLVERCDDEPPVLRLILRDGGFALACE